MKTLYLIRHGESCANVDPSIYFRQSDSEIVLTDLGKKQSIACGQQLYNRLKFDKDCTLFYSPFRRAKDTATLIDQELIKCGVFPEMIEEPLIYERSWGELANIIETPEFDRVKHFDFYYRPVQGESFCDCYNRVILFFQELRAMRDLSDNIVIVSHGEWIRLAMMYLRKYSIKYFLEYRKNPDNCIITELSECEWK